jgi:signal peptidase I
MMSKMEGKMPKEKLTKEQIRKEVISWIAVIALGLGLGFLVNKFVFFTISSPTASMEDTFLIDEKVVILRTAYLFSKPQRGDIVVFPFPDDESMDYIKRIIGLPNETIEGKNGVVYINGEPLEEDYFKEPPEGDFGPYEIPEGHYFMMGDNRNISEDARDWDNKFVAEDKIKGKAIFKYPDFKWFSKVEY